MQDANKPRADNTGTHVDPYIHTLDGRKAGRPNIVEMIENIAPVQEQLLGHIVDMFEQQKRRTLYTWIGLGAVSVLQILVWIF